MHLTLTFMLYLNFEGNVQFCINLLSFIKTFKYHVEGRSRASVALLSCLDKKLEFLSSGQ